MPRIGRGRVLLAAGALALVLLGGMGGFALAGAADDEGGRGGFPGRSDGGGPGGGGGSDGRDGGPGRN